MKLHKYLPPIISFVVLCAVFEFLVQKNIISSILFPAPSQVFAVLGENSEDFKTAFFETSNAVIKGYLLSIFLGLFIALVFSLSTYLRRSILPFAIFFQTVPI